MRSNHLCAGAIISNLMTRQAACMLDARKNRLIAAEVVRGMPLAEMFDGDGDVRTSPMLGTLDAASSRSLEMARLFAAGTLCRRDLEVTHARAVKKEMEYTAGWKGLTGMSHSLMHRCMLNSSKLKAVAACSVRPSNSAAKLAVREALRSGRCARTLCEDTAGQVWGFRSERALASNVKLQMMGIEALDYVAGVIKEIAAPDPRYLLPARLDADCFNVASSIHGKPTVGDMSVLADAIEDTGRDDGMVAKAVEHCRGGGDHLQGCWVIDWVTGAKWGVPLTKRS